MPHLKSFRIAAILLPLAFCLAIAQANHSGQSVAAAPQLASLRQLSLHECKVTDRGLEAIAKSPHAEIARFLAAFGCQPGAIMAPETRAFVALVRRPGRRIDAAAAPAILDQKL